MPPSTPPFAPTPPAPAPAAPAPAGPAPATPTATTPTATDEASRPLALALVVGSVRAGRLGPAVADWFAGHARDRDDVHLDVLDLAAFPLPADMAAAPGSPPERLVRALGERLAAADGFVVVTPEYNHSYPAALKNVIDTYRQEWFAKPVGFVSYGGVSGGLRAVEHLRAVFAEQHAVTVRDGVSFHGPSAEDFAAGGPAGTAGSPASAAANRLLDRLGWWGRALRHARAAEPYADS
ncbi:MULTISPECIES: NADPH-dependent FMN reductase [unclassified Frankia]|uniref:NADPH-dependent FMN reductase n=1 Tax=unclassified Frankia TaxID=2632575 RepID=UPI0007079733|nr:MULTISPECIES: NAD(P)H-dependent oxidoreductase [unclassified Frankia]KQM02410.1 putative flavoprotein [Frankia sp. CpI1-P]